METKRGILKPISCTLAVDFESHTEAHLSDDMLTWDQAVEFGDGEEYPIQGMKQVPVKDSLLDFVRLADATPEQVLDFVRKRGVLACDPLVELALGGSSTSIIFRFSEPVFFYTRLARLFRYLLAALRFLTERTRIKPSERCDLQHVLPFIGNTDLSQLESHYLYSQIHSCLEDLWDANQPRLTIRGMSGGITSMLMSFPSADPKWDMRRAKQFNDGLLRTVRPHCRLDDDDFKPRMEMMPYREYAKEVANLFPLMRGGRRSPLLGVLVWQMLEKVSLPEHTYQCSNCGGLYSFDERHYKPNRKPHKNRRSWCKQECENEDKLARDRKRKRKPKGEAPGSP
jgi:hypothetical protein